MEVSFTITDFDGNEHSTTADAAVNVPVKQPTISGDVYYLKGAHYFQEINMLKYVSTTGAKLPPGKSWPDGENVHEGTVPGIDFQYLEVPQNQGRLEIEQILLLGSSAEESTNGDPVQYQYLYYYENPTTHAMTAAPLPLLDCGSAGGAPPSSPWYPISSDSPSLDLDYDKLKWTLNFVDYVMFMPAAGGIWVPEATVTWSLDVTATKDATGWTSAVTPTVSCQVNHTAWPQAWNDLAYIYDDWRHAVSL